MSTTKDPEAALRPGCTSVLLMNLMVLAHFTPHFRPCAKRPLSFDVDLIQCILYRNNVMSSLCFNDLPVSGQITALAISGMMIICLFFVGCAISGVFDGMKKLYLLVVLFHVACPVTG
jgi:hypothetical protein